MKRLWLVPVLMAAIAASAQAEPPATSSAPAAQKPGSGFNILGSGHNSNLPINVTADDFTGDLNTKIGTYTGNVIVTQGSMKMRADRVQVNVTGDKPSRIVASGNIVVTSQSGIATGDNGIYDVDPRIITLTGNVVLTKDKNVMRGTSLQVNLVTGEAHLQAKGMTGGRVQGSFTPRQSTTGNPQSGNGKPNGSKGK